MDDSQLRALVAELGAVKDTAKRQQKALKSLQVLVSKGTNISVLLPVIIDLATGDCEKNVWQDAIQLLAGVIGYPTTRERCSYPSSVFRTLVQALSKGDPRAATAILSSIEQLPPEDFLKLLESIEPETFMRRSMEYAPSIRPMVVKTFGVSLVKSWPLVTAVSDENMRDSCVEGLRAVFSVLSKEEADDELCLAAGAILDELMLRYLNISPGPMAVLALFHPAWEFRPMYATLFLELLRDMKAALPRLMTLTIPDPQDCVWVPSRDHAMDINKAAGLPQRQGATGLADADKAVVAEEASAFRAALLWLLAFGGGVGRAVDTEPGGECFVVNLGIELGGGPKKPIPQLPPPPELLAQRLGDATRSSGAWGASFARSRARLTVLLTQFVQRSDVGQLQGAVLAAAEALQQLEGEVLQHPALRAFVAEVLCSLVALWHVMGADPSSSSRACAVSAEALVLGASVAPKAAGATPARLVQLMELAAKVFVLNGKPSDLQHFARPLSKLGETKLPRLALLLLAKSCHVALAGSCGGRLGESAGSMLESLVQQHLLPSLLEIAAAPEGEDAANHKEALPQAAVWLLAATARGSTRAQKAVQDALNSRDLLSKAAPTMFAAGCVDEQLLMGLTPSTRANLAEGLKGMPDLGEEWSQQQRLLAQALGQGRSPGALLPTALCHGPLAAQMAGWRHLAAVAGPAPPQRPKMISVSGPPLFVYVTPTITWVAGVHVGIRIDRFNATALSLRNVGIQLGVSRPTRMGERVGKEGKPWHYPDGLLKPLGSPNIEAITSRSSATLWRDLYLHFPPKPLSLALTLSYTKVLLESSSGLTPMSTPVANSAAEDVWSDDEEGGDRFHFACFPVSMGLSTYFRPFLGFDFPEKVPLPPPLLLASCSQSKTQSAKDLQLPEDWTLRGFHCLSGPGPRCLAGIACDNETLLCFILRHSRDSPSLEIRSNNEWLIQAVCDSLMFWILACV